MTGMHRTSLFWTCRMADVTNICPALFCYVGRWASKSVTRKSVGQSSNITRSDIKLDNCMPYLHLSPQYTGNTQVHFITYMVCLSYAIMCNSCVKEDYLYKSSFIGVNTKVIYAV